MTNFKTPLRGQQELTLLGSEKTTSSASGFYCVKKSKISDKNMPSEAWQNKKRILRKEDLLYEIRFEYEMA